MFGALKNNLFICISKNDKLLLNNKSNTDKNMKKVFMSISLLVISVSMIAMLLCGSLATAI